MAEAAAPVRFAIGPLSWGITRDEFGAWLARAAADDEIPYAGGPALPHEMPVVAAVTAARLAGQVRTHVVKRDGRTLYIAVRRAEVAQASAPALGEAAARMLDLLTRTAAAGKPCPSNTVLGISLGLKGKDGARYVFGELVKVGAISVENRGPKLRRIVTICATGKRTAG